MADQVQRVLEEMVPELEDLEERGLLSGDEIRALVAARKDFEYKLQRRTVLKEDYLRYITYELNLNALRLKRKKRMGQLENSASDFASKQRISFIYERAIRKFKGDKSLWFSAIEFATENKSERVLSQLFARSVQMHPREPRFWILAASHELNTNGNVGAARQLMQRGLRVNRTVPEMWHEYFRLELLFVYKVIGRRRVLGIVEPDTDGNPDNKDGGKKRKSNTTANGSGVSSEELDQEAQTAAKEREVLQQGTLLKIVFQNALQAIPGDTKFGFQFLNIAEEFANGGEIDSVARLVIKEISSALVNGACGTEGLPELWDMAANFRFQNPSVSLCEQFESMIDRVVGKPKQKKSKKTKDNSSKENAMELLLKLQDRDQLACAVFTTGFVSLPHEKVHCISRYFMDFVVSRVETANDTTNEVSVNTKDLVKFAVRLIRDTIDEGDDCVDAATLAKLVRLCGSENVLDNEHFLDLVNKGLSMYPDSCVLWMAKIESLSNDPVRALREVRKALDQVALVDSLRLWLLRLDLVMVAQQNHSMTEQSDDSDHEDSDESGTKSAHEQILNEFMDTIAKLTVVASKRQIANDQDKEGEEFEPSEDPVGIVLSGMIEWANNAQGLEFVRNVYQTILKRGVPAILPVSVFIQVATLEASQGPHASDMVRQILEKAVLVHPTSEDLWMWYLAFEQHKASGSNAKRVQQILWRASKKVPDPKGFEEKWLLNRG